MRRKGRGWAGDQPEAKQILLKTLENPKKIQKCQSFAGPSVEGQPGCEESPLSCVLIRLFS